MNQRSNIFFVILIVIILVYQDGLSQLPGNCLNSILPQNISVNNNSNINEIVFLNGNGAERELRLTSTFAIRVAQLHLRNVKLKIYAQANLRIENIKLFDGATCVIYVNGSLTIPKSDDTYNPFPLSGRTDNQVKIWKNSKLIVAAQGNIDIFSGRIEVLENSKMRLYACSNIILSGEGIVSGHCYRKPGALQGTCCMSGDVENADDQSSVDIGARNNIIVDRGTYCRRSLSLMKFYGKNLMMTPVIGPFLMDFPKTPVPGTGRFLGTHWEYEEGTQITSTAGGATISIGAGGPSLDIETSFIYFLRYGGKVEEFCVQICPQGKVDWDLNMFKATELVLEERFKNKDQDDNDIFIFPNPTSGDLFIKFSDSLDIDEVNILLYDINGSLINQEMSINVSKQAQFLNLINRNLPKGKYILNITKPTGEIVFGKLIIFY